MVGALQGHSARFQVTNCLHPYKKKGRKTTKLFLKSVWEGASLSHDESRLLMLPGAFPSKVITSKEINHRNVWTINIQFMLPLTIMLKMKTYQTLK